MQLDATAHRTYPYPHTPHTPAHAPHTPAHAHVAGAPLPPEQ